MRKFSILFSLSVVVMALSLSYINYVLLSNSTIDTSNVKVYEKKLNNQPDVIGYFPDNYSSLKFNSDMSKSLFIANDMLYLFNFGSETTELLSEVSFVQSCDFLTDQYIIYTSTINKVTKIKVLNIVTREIYTLGSLNYENFLGIGNVRIDNEHIYLDVDYYNNEERKSKAYVYKNGYLNSDYNSTGNIKSLNINGCELYTTVDNNTYINGSLFTYNDNSMFEIVGADVYNVVYLLNKQNNNQILSLSIYDGVIDILEDVQIDGINYNKIFCSDDIYLVGEDFIFDINDGVKVSLANPSNIILINQNTIYFEDKGILMKQIY